ncbi:hypothetical protein ACTQ4E_05305 [Lawsonibacter sp. LCP25S3_G6]|uniref:hypothetical protein n=1 Tax=unclassified Lawsonibacter TaxID=2617946 RepID=UPI003F95B1F1
MKYQKYGDMVICAAPDEGELDWTEIENIVRHTHNTWQHDRKEEETRKNTIQGKKAELVMERLLSAYSSFRYLSYDRIRRDDFKKHAPFDGLIYPVSLDEGVKAEAIQRICSDVQISAGDSGVISVETRTFLASSGIFTVEIKSSLLQDPRDYQNMEHKENGERTQADYQALCGHIREFYDYFVYPHYCRDSEAVTCFYEYTTYVRRNHPELTKGVGSRGFLYRLMETEFDHACDIYTRVFFDVLTQEIIIPGYILKTRFFEEPRIQKMYSSKSYNALYYMYHMRYGRCILSIDEDDELLHWERDKECSRLFGAKKVRCPNCGNLLKIREVTTRPDPKENKFHYLCDSCQRNKWFTFKQIHPQNMENR